MNPGLVLAATLGGAALLLVAVAFGCDVSRLIRDHREKAARNSEPDWFGCDDQSFAIHASEMTDVAAR
jgi:hypothetical protein